MKRARYLSLVFCLLLASAWLHAQEVTPAQAPSGKPKMEISKPVFDAGTVYRSKDKIEHAFLIKNTGTADLKILSARPG
jgi:hypothetical protein